MSKIKPTPAPDTKVPESPDQQGGLKVEPGKSAEPREVNGPRGLEPTRYGDWESRGRCHDF